MTLTLVAIVGGILCLQIFLWPCFLWLGLRWTKTESVSWRRIAVVTVCVLVIQVAYDIPFGLVEPQLGDQAFWLHLLELGLGVLVPCLIITRVFKTGFVQSVMAWLPTLIPSVGGMLFSFLVFRPFLFEAFVNPSMAMAPTLLGEHVQLSCPDCGQPGFVSPWNPRPGMGSVPQQVICENFHVFQTDSNRDRHGSSADRFLVAKFIEPQRWDLIAFSSPGDPSVLFVKRLVGLPGETIHIDQGGVWSDGEKLEPPEEIKGIEYLPAIPGMPGSPNAAKDNPAVLGENEYFVLGDFSAISNDSRLWSNGAAGHPPYAVPRSSVQGVVTHILATATMACVPLMHSSLQHSRPYLFRRQRAAIRMTRQMLFHQVIDPLQEFESPQVHPDSIPHTGFTRVYANK